MKKVFLLVMITLLFVFPLISAINLKIEEETSDVAMIKDLSMPAVFNLKITNNGESNYFMFYSFFGSDSYPKGTVPMGMGETKKIEVGIYPREDLKQEGRIQFDLFIKGQDGDEMSYPLMINVITLKDAFEVGAEEFNPESSTISVYIKNIANFNFKDIKANFKSPFFNFEKTISLIPYQKEKFEITLNKEDFRSLMAGFYTINAEITAEDQKADVEGVIRFSEKDIVTSSQNEYGIIVYTKTISKVNEGNIISKSSTTLKKSIISRLFTTFSPEPSIVERKGLSVYYTWEQELKPGEKIEIVVKTNWLLPLLAVLLVIAVVVLTKQFSRTNVSVKKKINFVKAKGGEFALKVSVIITARKFIERVNLIDRLPMLSKLHERFGGEMPKKIDEKNRRLEWYFDKMQEGESRIVSYIIYSKVGVIGKFALPTATAVYERDGELHEAESNHAFFLADQVRKEVED